MSDRMRSGYFLLASGLFYFMSGAAITAQELSYAMDSRNNGPVARAVGTQVSGALESRISLNAHDRPLRDVINDIASLANIRVVLGDNAGQSNRRVTVKRSSVTVRELLDDVLSGSGLTYRVMASGHLMISAGRKTADGILTGKVIDAKTRRPVQGALVLLNDDTKGIETDEAGMFRLTVPQGEHRITVRLIGFDRQTRRVTISSDQTVTLEIQLQPSANVLGEVVVTGTVLTTERKAIPTPITVIDGKELERRGITRIDQLLRGEVPGVLALEQGTMQYMGATQSYQTPGAVVQSKVYSRGSASLNGEPNPLKTFVDGVEILDPAYLGTIDPQSIERIEVITGPQAVVVYGSGAMGGVMQIFTKHGSDDNRVDVKLRTDYGMLESNLSSGRTPVHNHLFNVSGGNGTGVSFSGTASHTYQGQWMPGVYSRRLGANVGAQYVSGDIRVQGSASLSYSRNGTFNTAYPATVVLTQAGEMPTRAYGTVSKGLDVAVGQIFSMNVSYTPSATWKQSLTVGRSQNNFSFADQAPVYESPSDSSLVVNRMNGARTTLTYSGSFQEDVMPVVSTTFSYGANGTWSDQLQARGTIVSPTSSSYMSPSVSTIMNDKSGGLFGSWQIGFAERLYLTLGMRGDWDKRFGRDNRMSWIPTSGIAYTLQQGELSVKMLASYGRSSRAPTASMQLPVIRINSNYDPSEWIGVLGNPGIRPEVSRGPQFGLEMYYGNWGSLTVNRYMQDVTDLIVSLRVDSLPVREIATGDTIIVYQSRYENIAKMHQHGWELTGAGRVGALTLKGTYSWNDSRIRERPGSSMVGQVFNLVPTHFANVTLGYSLGRTTATLVSNYVGSSTRTHNQYVYRSISSRTRMYAYRGVFLVPEFSSAGYVKSDLTVMHRISSSLDFNLKVENLGNSFGTEENNAYIPALGRVTTLGLAVRLPN